MSDATTLLGPNDLAAEASKIAAEPQMIETFVRRLIGANGAKLTSEQSSQLYEALDLDETRIDAGRLRELAHSNAAVRRAGLDHLIPLGSPTEALK